MFRFSRIIAVVALLATAASSEVYKPRLIPAKPDKAVIGSMFDRQHVEVKFVDDADIGLTDTGVPVDRSVTLMLSAKAQNVMSLISDAGGSWSRMSPLGEALLDEKVNIAENALKREIADLNNYFILTVPDEITTEEWLDQLNSLPEVEIALAMPLPTPLPLIPPSYQTQQGYLDPAPNGIDAASAWAIPGGNGWPSVGGPIKICDFEYSWNLNHVDYSFINYSYSPSYSPSDPYSDNNHGTAVLGELKGLNNGWGVTGCVPSAQVWASPTYLNGGWQLGVAMTWMISAFGPGDVFLIEQQFAGPNYTGSPPGTQNGLIPVEWWLSWYN
ncbi:MAG: hypothetical protein V3T31_11595, partial [candidate division Zixibacteria bacterium]